MVMAMNRRQRLVDTATEVIMEQGFAAASVDEICSRAGASKGSFYHFFESKSEIGEAVLEAWFTRVRAATEGGPYQTEGHPGKRLMGYVNHMKNLSPGLWGRGSVLAAVATELGGPESAVSEACRRLVGEATSDASRLFEPASESLDRSPTARDLARLFLAVTEGAALLARAEGRPELASDTLDTFQLCLKKILEYTPEPA